MKKSSERFIALWVLFFTALTGGGGLVAIGLFIFFGPPGWVEGGWQMPGALIWDASLSMLFFLQHSTMIRRSVRRGMERWVSEEYSRAIFSMTSGVFLFVVVLFWQTAGPIIVALTGPWRWLARLCFIAALAGFLWTGKSLQAFDPLGTGPMLARLGKTQPSPMPMTLRGPYRWVRHPFYFFTIVMIWSFPTLTVDRLVFNVMWTIWIWVGALLEERDLLATYGPAYEAYRKKVPCLLPFRWR